jgi:hypothetical protein
VQGRRGLVDAFHLACGAEPAEHAGHGVVGGADGVGDFADGGSSAVAVDSEGVEDRQFTSLIVYPWPWDLSAASTLPTVYRTYFRAGQLGQRVVRHGKRGLQPWLAVLGQI